MVMQQPFSFKLASSNAPFTLEDHSISPFSSLSRSRTSRVASDNSNPSAAKCACKYGVNGTLLFKIDIACRSLLKSAVGPLFNGEPCRNTAIMGPAGTRWDCPLNNSPTMDFDGQRQLSIEVYQ